MKLDQIQHLESLAAKNAAIMVEAKTLLELRAVVEWARRALPVLAFDWEDNPDQELFEHMIDELNDLVANAPADVRGE